MASDATAKLARHWGRSMALHVGASESAVGAFEARHGVRLAHSMRDYFLRLDGTGAQGHLDQDALGFSLWPLANVRPMNEELAAHKLPAIEGLEGYFAFADFLAWLWAYAIRLDTHGSEADRVVLVDGEKAIHVADSFDEFVDLYVTDSPRIYGGMR